MAKLSVDPIAAEVRELADKVAHLCNMDELRQAEIALPFRDQCISDIAAEELVQQAQHFLPDYSRFNLRVWNSWRSGRRPAHLHVTLTRCD